MSILVSKEKKVVFVVNPGAGMGSGGKYWPKVRSLASKQLGKFTFFMTTGPEDATHFTYQALREGADIIVCVGGDGTLNEVVNGFFEDDALIRPEAAVGFIPVGTGCDFIKSVPIPRDIEKAVDTIAKGHTRIIDLGLLQYIDHHARPASRVFHNVTSFGLGGEVDARANKTTKIFGGFISFIWATLISLLLYKRKRINLKIDSEFNETVVVWNIAVANGQYHGGGMWIAPEARVDDGLFHVTVVADLSLPQVFRHLPKLYNGKLLELEKVHSFIAKRIEARSEEKVLLDVDGEQPGQLPAIITIVPGGLRILTPE